MGRTAKEAAVWSADVFRPNWALGHFFHAQLGQGQFHVEVTVVAEVGFEFDIGQVDLFEQSRKHVLAVVFANNMVCLAILDIVAGFNDDATFLAIESAGDFGRLESTEVEAEVKFTVAIAIEDANWVVDGVVFMGVRWTEADIGQVVEIVGFVVVEVVVEQVTFHSVG